MAVARNPVLSKRAHVHALPPSWGTLYELSRLPEPVLEAAITAGTITPSMERSEARALAEEPRRIAMLSPTATVEDLERLRGRKFGTIYADPPWSYGNQGTRAATDRHYPTMTATEIADLPIGDFAADDAHLHLWTTNAFLFEAKSVMEAWGFEYKSCFVWVKPQMGIGNYWRVSHEFLLFGIRGRAPFSDRGLMSWAAIDRTEHSRKPEQVRQMVERASPGPRLELFGRRVSEGWTVWGNEIASGLFDPLPEEIAP